VSDEGGAAALVEVRIVRLSVPVFRRASEQTDELLREFALIRGETTDHVPARLLAVVDELRARFGGFSAEPAAALDAAVAEDEDEIDLVYRVPTETAQAVVELSALLDEADEFCRAGDLLTLATPPEALAFRRWFLDEFVRQIEGEPPLPWPDAIRGGGAG
jgi:hypothetical protein